jgi:hypothetical protein
MPGKRLPPSGALSAFKEEVTAPTGGAGAIDDLTATSPSKNATCTRNRRTQIILFGGLATGRQPSGESAHN